MTPERVDPPDNLEPHRKRRKSAWQKTPLWVKITVGVCLVLAIASIIAKDSLIAWSQGQFGSKPAEQAATQTPIQNPIESQLRSQIEVQSMAEISGRKPKKNPGKAFDEVAAKLPAFDLQLADTELNSSSRRIVGKLLNKSDRPYTDVKIIFALPSSDLRAQSSTTVNVPRLAPGETTKFVTDPLPPGVREWALVNVTGTPPKPQPPH
jgi:hypothetical protein